MDSKKYLDNLFRSLGNRNKWDSWTFIFRLLDGGHVKIKDVYDVGESLSFKKALIDIRRKQYLDKMTPEQKRCKKSRANKRLKSEIKKFCS